MFLSRAFGAIAKLYYYFKWPPKNPPGGGVVGKKSNIANARFGAGEKHNASTIIFIFS